MSQSSKYAIETISLTKAFKDWWGRTKVLAVDELDLKVEHNEVYGLLGPNGSGKSTTIKMLLSLLKPTKGVGFVLGGMSSNQDIASRIGFLPEESYLYKYLSASETLRFYGNLFGLPRKILETRIEALLDMVGLSAMANRPIGTFSKGMARRIGLAQALINDPDLLILDEPTSGLDPIGTKQIKDLIVSMAKRGKTILMCSHLLADVEDVCDRIGILYGGKMQTEGCVHDLLQHKDQNQIVTSQLSESALNKIKEIVRGENAEIEITKPLDKLENLFVNIVNQAQNSRIETSGAVSTTRIGDFLSVPSQEAGILEKLVGADVAEAAEPEQVQKETEHVEELEKVDNSLLEGLASVSVSDEIESSDMGGDETDKVEKNDLPPDNDVNVDKNLLNDLLRGPDKVDGKSEEIVDE